MTEVERSQNGSADHLLTLTFQYLYNESSDWDWNIDDDVLYLNREGEEIIENESIIPKAMFEENPDLKPENFSILYDILRIGIILYQSNALTHCTTNKTSRNFDFLHPEFTLLTTTEYHLAKLNRSIGNVNYINVLISHLKFERFLVAFFLKDTRSVQISFTGYTRDSCSELDRMFYGEIKSILEAFQHIGWGTLTTKSHLRKVLLRVQATRELLISRLIKDYLVANETNIFEALIAYTRLMNKTPFNLNQILYKKCIKATIIPPSNVLNLFTHPERAIDALNSSIARITEATPGVSIGSIKNNFLLSMPLKCEISTRQAHQIVSKYAKADTSVQLISPEDEQGTSFTGLVDFIISITANPDNALSLLLLICSGKHPSLSKIFSE